MHRKPARSRLWNSVCLAVALMFATPAVAYAYPDKPAVLSKIMQCESGGENVRNSSGSSASGYYQITRGTWQDFGGRAFASEAIKASKAEQTVVAKRIYAKRGTQPWNASKKCWSK